MERIYESLLREHLGENRQMAFLSGPRQVGKTTTARASSDDHRYLSWDLQSDRRLFTQGPGAVAEALELTVSRNSPLHVVLDEIHKYSKWKQFLKGFFDAHEDRMRMVVTGSAHMNIFKSGGDSLMGRYFLYRMHPITIAELGGSALSEKAIADPARPAADAIEQLLEFGGFPEPFLRGNRRFSGRWQTLRSDQLFREDLRDLSKIQEIGQVQVLAELLVNQVGQLLNYSTLAVAVNAAVETVKRWIQTLGSLYFCYTIRPWYRNVPRSLRKQPKVYLYDWSLVPDAAKRKENFVASHLLKATQWWTDFGLGNFELFFLRDKSKREVDFLVTRDEEPWFLVEVKSSSKRDLSPALVHFSEMLELEHAFQLVFDLDYVEENAFARRGPLCVPASTLLSQLV